MRLNFYREAENAHTMVTGRNLAAEYDASSGLPDLPGLGGLAATTTYVGSHQPEADVMGSPTAKVLRGANGEAIVLLQRRTAHSAFVTNSDLTPLREVMRRVKQDAISLSQGPLSLKALGAMNHPYGRGPWSPSGYRRGKLGRLQAGVRMSRSPSRGGVRNTAVINRQSGALQGKWHYRVQRSKQGVDMILYNTAEYAAYLALGTTRMKAHGPFTSAFLRQFGTINMAWLQITRNAWRRRQAAAAAGLELED